jgi:ADP-ribosylglycohydrolase
MSDESLELLQGLLRRGLIDVEPSPLLTSVAEPAVTSRDRVEGMLLGVAVGDALGNPTEGITPGARRAQYGEIRDYLPTHFGLAVPTDDTQLTFWTVEHLLEHGRLVPELLARRFASERIFGIGATVREFVANMDDGRPWYQAGPKSAGNGALMRIAPLVLPSLAEGGAVWADVALGAMITHNDAGSTAACLAFAAIFRDLLQLDTPPDGSWWVDRYTEVARQVERGDYRTRTPHLSYDGPIWAIVDTQVRQAVDRQEPAVIACERWYSGAYLLETVPSALQILALHAHDPDEALVRAVNDTRDNDTVAAIVGAAVGALHGREALPRRLTDGLAGRTGADDDGRVFELVSEASAQFAPAA